MTDEKVHHVCCVCGKMLPQMTGYELVQKGCGMNMGNGSHIYFCRSHTAEDGRKYENLRLSGLWYDNEQGSERCYQYQE